MKSRGSVFSVAQLVSALGVLILLLILASQFGAKWGLFPTPLIPLSGKVEAWAAIMVAVCVQSFPFLVLGVVVSALIETVAPAGFLKRLTPRSPLLAVPAASLTSMVLPGCECASVPVAQSFMRNGVDKAAALVFMLASPAVNPVVLVSTAVAFYTFPTMVWARLFASLVAVIVAGWLWYSLQDFAPIKSQQRDPDSGLQVDFASEGGSVVASRGMRGSKLGSLCQRWPKFRAAVLHDLTQAGGFLVLGAAAAGLVKVAVPVAWFQALSQRPFLAVLVMAGMAILLSLCSEADAFVAASFSAVSPTAQLAFMVVGPMVDIKLISMQIGAFGIKFVRVFLPMVLVCGLVASTLVGVVMFGVIPVF